MNAGATKLGRIAAQFGTLSFLAWTFLIGIGGLFLLCALAYAMVTENLALGVVCGLLFVTPWVLGIAWVVTGGASLLAERRAQETKSAQAPALTPERSPQRL